MPDEDVTSARNKFEPVPRSELVIVREVLVPVRSTPFKVQATKQLGVDVVTE